MSNTHFNKNRSRAKVGLIFASLLIVPAIIQIISSSPAFAFLNPPELCEQQYSNNASFLERCLNGDIDLAQSISTLPTCDYLHRIDDYNSEAQRSMAAAKCRQARTLAQNQPSLDNSSGALLEACRRRPDDNTLMDDTRLINVCVDEYRSVLPIYAMVDYIEAYRLRQDLLEGNADSSYDNTGTGAGARPTATCETEIKGAGWFLCTILNTLTSFLDSIWDTMVGLLSTQPLTMDTQSTLYQTWASIRNIANAILAVIFLIIIYSQLTGVGMSNFGIKKALPRLIIAAIAINISYFLLAIAFDGANILGVALKDLIAGNAVMTAPNIADLTAAVVTGGLGTGIVAGVAISIAGPAASLIFILLLLIVAVVTIMAGIIALFVRTALLPIIAVFAPLAIAASVLPNTKPLFDKWQKTFTSMLFLFPIASVYFGALQLTAYMLMGGSGNSGSTLERLIGAVLLFLGGGVIAILAIKSNSITNKVYGAVKGAVNKVTTPVTSGLTDVRKGMSEEHKGKSLGREGAGFMGSRAFMKSLDRGKKDREIRTALRKADYDQKYQEGLFRDPSRLLGLEGTTAGIGYMNELELKILKNADAQLDDITIVDRGKERKLSNKEKLDIAINGRLGVGENENRAQGDMIDYSSINTKLGSYHKLAAIQQMEKASASEKHQLAIASANANMSATERKAIADVLVKSGATTSMPWVGGASIPEIQSGTFDVDIAMERAANNNNLNAEAIMGGNASTAKLLLDAANRSPANSALRESLKEASAKIMATEDLRVKVTSNSELGNTLNRFSQL